MAGRLIHSRERSVTSAIPVNDGLQNQSWHGWPQGTKARGAGVSTDAAGGLAERLRSLHVSGLEKPPAAAFEAEDQVLEDRGHCVWPTADAALRVDLANPNGVVGVLPPRRLPEELPRVRSQIGGRRSLRDPSGSAERRGRDRR